MRWQRGREPARLDWRGGVDPGAVVVITGATSGIGLAMAGAAAAAGASLVLACRNPDKAQATAAALREASGNPRIRVVPCNLASQCSVRQAAERIQTAFGRVDVLVNNAGIMNPRRHATADGLEETFATNYLGPFLLTHCVLDALRASPQGRIVNVTSAGHFQGRLDLADLQGERRYNGVRAYNQSKLALVMFTHSLSARLAGTQVAVNCVHPGIVHSNIWPDEFLYLRIGSAICRLFAVPADKGAEGPLHLALSPCMSGVTGRYFHGVRERRSKRLSYDAGLQARLWAVTSELAGLPAGDAP